MNEEYLWDKSGEPDPEIQQLEDILGTLRYQPKALELPREVVQPHRRNRYLPLLAIAATLLIALLAGVVWLRLQSHAPVQKQEAVNQPPVPSSSPSREVVVPDKQEKVVQHPTQPRHRELVASNAKHRSQPADVPTKEALLAKEQLMSALRLASEKLSFAQRKTQGPAQNQIRNQHKIG